jgi:hypothetical protein
MATCHNPTLTIQIVMDITYETNGVDHATLKRIAEAAIQRELGNGGFTGESDAVIDQHSIDVIETTSKANLIDQASLEQFLADQIENSQIQLGQIPALMARFALASPAAMRTEMSERMRLDDETPLDQGISKQDGPRITATFVPQAWVGDHAVELDDGGFDVDVTAKILRMPLANLQTLGDDQYSTDDLVDHNHDGPFLVEVESSLTEFFMCRSCAEITQQMLDEKRAEYGVVIAEAPMQEAHQLPEPCDTPAG